MYAAGSGSLRVGGAGLLSVISCYRPEFPDLESIILPKSQFSHLLCILGHYLNLQASGVHTWTVELDTQRTYWAEGSVDQ